MVKKLNQKTSIIIYILLFIIICIILYNLYIQNISIRAIHSTKDIEGFTPPSPTIIVTPPSNNEIQRSPKEVNSMDRFWNPLRYPYRSDYFYDQGWYPNNNLPFQVIGGGHRNTPTLGGTEIPIANPSVPINIAEAPIAPINITTRGPRGLPQQLGVIYKVQGDNNTYLPLFGMKEYPNSQCYKYYTALGHNSQIKVPIITRQKNVELGDNDEVMIKGDPNLYRTVMYENSFPQYVPYL
jgi:hypothetical protein